MPKMLTPELNGLLRVVYDAAMLFVPFVLLGSSSVAVRFFPYIKNRDNGHEGFLGLLLFVASVGMVVFCLLFALFYPFFTSLFADKSPLFAQFGYYTLPLCLFFTYNTLFEAYLRSLQYVAITNFTREIYVRLGVSLTILLYAYGNIGISGLIAAYTLVFGSAAVILVLFTRQKGELFWRPPSLAHWWQHPLRRDMLHYAFFVLLGGSSAMLVNKIDSVMLSALKGLSDNGIFNIAFFMGVIVEMPRRAITQVASPIIADLVKQQQWDTIAQLYRRISLNQFVAGCFILLGIWVNIGNLYQLMPNGALYTTGKYVVLFIGLSKLFDMVTSINTEIITYSRYYRYDLAIMLLLVLLTIGFNLLLIPPYGITGAAAATALAILLYNTLRCLLIWRLFRIQPLSFATLKVLSIVIFAYGLNYLLPTLPTPILDIAVRSTLLSFVFFLLLLYSKTAPDFNALAYQILQKIRHYRFKK